MPEFFQPLMSWQYWFQNPGMFFSSPFNWIVFIVMAFLVLAGIDVAILARLRVKDKERREAFGKAQTWLITMGLAGLALYGAAYEGISLFSMRVWLAVWFVGFFYWGYRVTIHFLKVVPSLQEMQSERAAYEKWLPKPKR
jgi:hypothetical protein